MDEGLLETFAYEKRYWYPHMKPKDVTIWERFIEKEPNAFLSVQYDVPVGTVADFVKEGNPKPGAGEELLYKRKIDVVGFNAGAIFIIELKPSAGSSAVGQIKLYDRLYKRDYSPPISTIKMIITDKMDDDVQAFAHAEGVRVIIVPEEI